MPQDQNNPYSKASGVYDKQKQETPDQRELEAHLLIKAAGELQRLYDRWDEATTEDISNILTYNRKLWSVFLDTAVENPDDRPAPLRENILGLCNFVFKRTISILAEPDKQKVLVLIDINREIAAGLNTKPQSNAPEAAPEQQKDTNQDETKGGSGGGFTPTSA